MKLTAKRVYNVAKKQKFDVEYAYTGGKWNFRIGSFTLLTEVIGGRPVADKIALAIHKAYHRSGRIDAACRLMIKRLLEVKTLSDWKPDRYWTGFQVETPQSPQVRG